MPNFNSTLATAAASALTDGSVTTKSQDVASPVLYAAGEIVIPAGLANTDTFTLVAASQLPVGAKVDPLLSFFYAETNPGTTLAFDVGTPADPDKYADNLALGGSSGVKQFGASGTCRWPSVPKRSKPAKRRSSPRWRAHRTASPPAR